MNSEQNPDAEYNKLRQENQKLQQQNQELHQQNELLRLEREERLSEKLQRQEIINRFIKGIYYLGGALIILLTLRFLLLLLAANPNNIFASFIFQLSNPFASPFANLFDNPQIGTNSSFEITTIVAIAIYSLLIWLVVHLLKIIWD
jgi:hypothetical protein